MKFFNKDFIIQKLSISLIFHLITFLSYIYYLFFYSKDIFPDLYFISFLGIILILNLIGSLISKKRINHLYAISFEKINVILGLSNSIACYFTTFYFFTDGIRSSSCFDSRNFLVLSITQFLFWIRISSDILIMIIFYNYSIIDLQKEKNQKLNLTGLFNLFLVDFLFGFGFFLSFYIETFFKIKINRMIIVLNLLIILYSTNPLLKHSISILMFSRPESKANEIDLLISKIYSIDGVIDIILKKFWIVHSGFYAGKIHLKISQNSNSDLILQQVHSLFKYLINYLTIQIEIEEENGNNFDLENKEMNLDLN
ncbi:zinc transporter 5 [Anaeramoeba ignava]|uniref:Zinc transporter 5 n=1 Tax=Anaeramoeba ignava TaxID=1746090 RepID=A0A9Q0LAW4_ANAIG|nr:zinc transporter 5 [Anaeramoeba ignava]